MNIVKRIRSNALLLNIIYAYVIKGFSVIIGVLLVKAYLKYFSSDSILGVWYTILSVISWIINFDLGIGQGLRNLSVKAFEDKDKKTIKKVVSSAYIGISSIAIVLLVISVIITYFTDWNSFFNISQKLISNEILQLSVIISFLGIIIQMVLKLVTSIFNALEKTAVTNLLTLSTNFIIVIFVMTYNGKGDANNLILLSLVYFIATTLPYAIVSIYVYSDKWKWFRPSFKMFDSKISKQIFSLSSKFFIVQIMLMVITVTNELFITRLVLVEQVVTYQIYYKLFGTILLFFSLVTNSVWSSITRKWQLGKYISAKKTYRILVFGAVMCSFGTFVFCLFIQPIVNIWLGSETIKIEPISTIIFLAYTIVMLLSYAYAAMANALSQLRVQMYCYLVAAILKYPLCMLLLKFNFDWSSIVLSNVLLMLPYVVVQPIVISKILSSKIKDSKACSSEVNKIHNIF